MSKFILFCKSYEGDLRRVQRLWQSVQRFNRDRIPLYISVPSADRALFEQTIGHHTGLTWISDEEIVLANPRVGLDRYQSWSGRLSQQVVKSEFWRLVECDSYLCLDSESEFIRNFYLHDFVAADGTPYTVMHQAKELLQLAENKGINKIGENFHRECAEMKAVFGRTGPDYDFGPTPVVWSSNVWQALDEQYLRPQGKTIWDAILERPSELRWYGESLLHFKSIPILPIEPLFRVYHHNWQWHTQRRLGETTDKLCGEYLGVLSQSSWQYEWDVGAQSKRKTWPSRLARSIKSFLARFR